MSSFTVFLATNMLVSQTIGGMSVWQHTKKKEEAKIRETQGHHNTKGKKPLLTSPGANRKQLFPLDEFGHDVGNWVTIPGEWPCPTIWMIIKITVKITKAPYHTKDKRGQKGRGGWAPLRGAAGRGGLACAANIKVRVTFSVKVLFEAVWSAFGSRALCSSSS